MTRTVMLLDVDGVLNASADCGWGTAPRTATVHAYGMGFPFHWAPELVDRIRALHDAGHVEIRWCTTWLDIGTEGVERVLGLPAFPPAFTHSSSTFRSEKVEAALAVVEAGDRLIWVDDEAIPTTGPFRTQLEDAGALLIVPDDRYGLRSEHMDAIGAFIGAGVP